MRGLSRQMASGKRAEEPSLERSRRRVLSRRMSFFSLATIGAISALLLAMRASRSRRSLASFLGQRGVLEKRSQRESSPSGLGGVSGLVLWLKGHSSPASSICFLSVAQAFADILGCCHTPLTNLGLLSSMISSAVNMALFVGAAIFFFF